MTYVQSNIPQDLEMALIQARQSANFYYEHYRNLATNFAQQRQQLVNQHENLQAITMELRWYQAAFPDAKSTYHLITDYGRKLEDNEQEGESKFHQSDLTPIENEETHIKKSSKKRKTEVSPDSKPIELRRSLRIQGIHVSN